MTSIMVGDSPAKEGDSEAPPAADTIKDIKANISSEEEEEVEVVEEKGGGGAPPAHASSIHRAADNFEKTFEDADHIREGLEMEEYQEEHGKYWVIKDLFCAAGLIFGIVILFIDFDRDNSLVQKTLAIAVWMATLWLTEAIPLVVTAFFPIILFPMFGILTSATVTSQYANDIIFLFISGFIMALALQRWNLHRRFALKLLSLCGVKPQLLLLGIMGGTFFLSMFVSNTATSLMMVPNALSICVSLEESVVGIGAANENDPEKLEKKRSVRKFAMAVLLGIAYSANVGGMSSIIGTPPNLVFGKQLGTLFPDAPEVTFATWLAFGIPIGLIMFVVVWLYLWAMYLRGLDLGSIDENMFKDQYAALGPWSREQMLVTFLFTLEAFLWIFRADLVFDSVTIEGWRNVFPNPSAIHDATVGMTIALVLFIFPARSENFANDAPGYENVPKEDRPRKTTLMDWKTANAMPYDIVFLFGGGFALAKAFVESGTSAWLGEQLEALDEIKTALTVFVVITLIIWLTELTSNTATSNIMIPIAASLSTAVNTNPFTFMIPVTLACSCAFALPIATPPNMVVFSTGLLPLREMNKAGLFLNIISSAVLMFAAFVIIPGVLNEDATGYPSWAETNTISGGEEAE